MAAIPTRSLIAFTAGLFALAASAGCATERGSAEAQLASPRSVTLSVVGTNDLHGGILPEDGRGGLALLSGYVNNLRAARSRDGGAVVLIDAGDMWQGTLESNLTEGASVVAVYNALGYTAAAIGNHEFDFGPVGPAATPQTPDDDPRGALKARAAEARFPLLAANLIDSPTNRPVEWPNVRPSVLLDVGGIHVGIVGVMTKEALTSTIAANISGLVVAPLTTTIAAEAAKLRSQGAEVVIVAAHAGGRCSRFTQPADLSSCESDAEIVDVARSLPPNLVDVIVAGHTHAGMAHEIAGIAVVEGFSGGRAFDRVDLTVDRGARHVTARRIFSPQELCGTVDVKTQTCAAGGAVSAATSPARYEGTQVIPDPNVVALLAPAIERARTLQATGLGVVLDTPIRRTDDVESPLGNLFTDAFRESIAGADVAINNTQGGLRADLPAGPLTYGNLFKVFPFDNRLVSLKLTGGVLRRLLAAQLQRGGDLLGISGIRVQARCSAGTMEMTILGASGQPIEDTDRVVIATTDFLATGPVFTRLMPPQAIATDAPLARDAVADWLRRRGGTLREEQLVDAAHPRWSYPGTLPVRCTAAR